MVLAPLATAAGVAFTGLRTAMLALSAANIIQTFQNITSAFNSLAGKVTLAGTAELGVDSIRIPYSGNTCLGNVSGTEVLKRN